MGITSMSLSSLMELFDNLQECCYIMADVLKVDEVLHYWHNQVSSIKTYLCGNMDQLQHEPPHPIELTQKNDNFKSIHDPLPDFVLSSVANNTIQLENKMSETFEEKQSPQFELPFRKIESNSSTPSSVINNSSDKHLCENTNLWIHVLNLEQEVDHLKKKLETLTKTNSLNLQESSKRSNIPEIVVDHVPLGTTLLPPPPPPPPPSIVKQTELKFKKTKSNVTPLKDRNSHNSRLDMAHVLKGLKDVKLKPTDRSPGGTPLRKTKYVSNDPNDVLQEALKRRFNGIHPEDDDYKENPADMWDQSPNKTTFKSP